MAGVRVVQPDPQAGERTPEIDTEEVVVDGETRQRQVIRAFDYRTLTERMFAKAPAVGYALWLDTADLTYIYLAEAPVSSDGTATDFRGIRVQKDATGNPLGKVQILDGFTWDTRTAAAWA